MNLILRLFLIFQLVIGYLLIIFHLPGMIKWILGERKIQDVCEMVNNMNRDESG